MTVMGAINHINTVKPNGYGQNEKIKWLSTLDGMIKNDVIDTHEGGENISFSGYSENSLMKELLAPHPYDNIYILWLEARMDYANGEYGRYNNSITAFNAAYADFQKWYNRTHMPLQNNFTHF
jgi:hypothetical protein